MCIRDSKYPMLSLANTYSEAEVMDFYDRVRKALNEDFEMCIRDSNKQQLLRSSFISKFLIIAIQKKDKGENKNKKIKIGRAHV